ncbi:MAG: hypothetical protein QXJ68_02215 [Methanocellales archaeon]
MVKLNESGQLYTLEALAAASLILAALLFITKATPLTPLTSSASNQQIEFYLAMLGQDLLTTSNYSPDPLNISSPLKSNILNWTGTRENNLQGKLNLSEFEKLLISTLSNRGIAYDLEIIYINTSKWDLATGAIIWNGEPSDNAVTVYESVVIYDSDKINKNNPIKDIDSTSDFYNLVLVKLTLWRM